MFVLASADAGGAVRVSLEQPDDCSRLHVEARGVSAQQAGEALARDGLGRVQGDHALLDPAALRRLASGAVEADWPERFDGMVAYAAGKGWVADDGSLQAHVELT